MAVVGLGGTLVGAAVGVGGTGVLQRQKHKRDDAQSCEAALLEVLVAATMYAHAVQYIRLGWVDGLSTADRLFKSARSTVKEIDALLMPRLERLLRALAVVSLWRERRFRPVVAAVLTLTDAAGELAGAMTGTPAEFEKAQEAFLDALGAYRRQVDAKPQGMAARVSRALTRGGE